MTEERKISLDQQIESVVFACTRQSAITEGRSVKSMRGRSVEEYELKRLQAAVRTRKWVRDNEDAFRVFDAERRKGEPA